MKTLSDAEKDLKEAGFVHVTGLVYSDTSQVDPIQPQRSDYGRWGHDEGSLILITEEGRIWMGFVPILNGIFPMINRVCPNGPGISLSCIFEIPTQLLLMRVRNPDADMFGSCPSDPESLDLESE